LEANTITKHKDIRIRSESGGPVCRIDRRKGEECKKNDKEKKDTGDKIEGDID
jgi:hypothetical protein